MFKFIILLIIYNLRYSEFDELYRNLKMIYNNIPDLP